MTRSLVVGRDIAFRMVEKPTRRTGPLRRAREEGEEGYYGQTSKADDCGAIRNLAPSRAKLRSSALVSMRKSSTTRFLATPSKLLAMRFTGRDMLDCAPAFPSKHRL